MPELLPIQCRNCQAQYAIPDIYRSHIEGYALLCPECRTWWIALRASSGPPVVLTEGKPVRSKVDLRRYRTAATNTPSDSSTADRHRVQPNRTSDTVRARASKSPDTSRGSGDSQISRTVAVPVVEPARRNYSLRVRVFNAGKEAKGVFDLGSNTFLIGKRGCHLNLGSASIPDRAIAIRTQEGGLIVDSIDGFPIPIGSMAVFSAPLASGSELELELPPYRLQLAVSATPGRPIKALTSPETARRPHRPSVQEVPKPPRPTGPGASPATDLRAAVQELAADIEQTQQAFGGSTQAPPAEDFDLDETITDIGASGFQAMRTGNPLDGLSIRLVKLESPSEGEIFRITKSPVLIGRAEGDLIIRDRRVSSKHAQIEVVDWRVYTLKDLASTNGTTVDERPISMAHLKSGEVLSFGGVRFEFVAEKIKR